MIAGSTEPISMAAEGIGKCSSGRPAGIGPITGASRSHRAPSRVPRTSPATAGGMSFANRRRQSRQMASVAAKMAMELTFAWVNASGRLRSAPTAPPGATGDPRSGNSWIRMMMTPMPELKPEMTMYGVWAA